ncbi:hypothetical protein [Flexivirga caeni]|uniref:hypothetical protein n=1 Tax=Flexivirga caeni TaxID=2294115 RepID=UPI0011CD7357|nr:hypothetical protein [Flexivirga caeni]
MPRLTNHTYLHIHHKLRELWVTHPQTLSLVSYRDQLALHRYFSPAIDEPDARHLAHRRWISEAEPSLPQRAGRAYQRLGRAIEEAQPAPGAAVRTPADAPRRLRVQGLARPELDVERIAQVIFEQVMTAVEQEQNNEHDEVSAV